MRLAASFGGAVVAGTAYFGVVTAYAICVVTPQYIGCFAYSTTEQLFGEGPGSKERASCMVCGEVVE